MRTTNAHNLASLPTSASHVGTRLNPVHHSASECIVFHEKRGVPLAYLNTRAPARIEPTFASPPPSRVCQISERTQLGVPRPPASPSAGANRTQNPPAWRNASPPLQPSATRCVFSTQHRFRLAHLPPAAPRPQSPSLVNNSPCRRRDLLASTMISHASSRRSETTTQPCSTRC